MIILSFEWWAWWFLGATLLAGAFVSAAIADRTKDERLALRWGLASYPLAFGGLLATALGAALLFFESLP